MKKLIALFLVCYSMALVARQTYIPDEHGEKLKQFYLGLDVEHLWIGGQHINWETGVADDPNATTKIKTHCSAFAAAACKKLNIHILNPYEHPRGSLANAQYDWLQTSEAAHKGWRPIAGEGRYAIAQDYANKGYVVVAVIKNPDPHKPGHTALVTPATITDSLLAESGPRLIMAGKENSNYISLKAGFKRHLTTWPEHDIEFYYFKDRVF